MAKIGILTIHGMGRQGPNFDRGLRERLSRRFDRGTRNDVVFQGVFYQDLLQDNEDRVWAEMDLAGGWFPRYAGAGDLVQTLGHYQREGHITVQQGVLGQVNSLFAAFPQKRFTT